MRDWRDMLGPTCIAWMLAASGVYAITGSHWPALLVVACALLCSGWIMLRLGAYSRKFVGRLDGNSSPSPDWPRPLKRCFLAATDSVAEALAEATASQQQRTHVEAKTHLFKRQLDTFQSVIEHLETPVLVTDAGDRPLLCNLAARRLLNLTAVDASERFAECPREVRELILKTRERASATKSRHLEMPLGDSPRMHRIKTELLEVESRAAGVLTQFFDIEQETEDNSRHAEFVSAASHELKTPLASMKAYIEMLLDGDVADAEEQREYLSFIDGQIDRTTRLVNDMLNLARIQSGVIKVQRVDCELNDVLAKSIETVRPTAAEKGVTLKAELSDLYLAAHIDPDLFNQAIINLLSNGVKYTPAGGQVRIRSRMDDTNAIIEIRDTGMGIPPSSLAHIFERFYRVPENKQAAEGTGLGLTMVHDVVTKIHNGQIDVASSVNEGTVFTLTIPLGHMVRKSRNATAKALA